MPKFFWILILLCLQVNAQEKHWHQRPLRILQTVLRETDVANYQVDSLINYLQKTNANTLVINGGGIVDFFQNALELSHVNPYLGKRDLLAEVVNACHKANIKVIARVDFRGVHKDRYDLHPDWFAKDEKGQPIILNYTTPELYAPCYNSYYRTEHSVSFISQLMERYHMDGIWHNSVNFHSTCYCDRCQVDFEKHSHQQIPTKASSHDDWERYYEWNSLAAERQLKLMRGTVKQFGEDKSYAAEVFDMYAVGQQKHTGISLYSAADYFDFLVIVSFMADNKSPVVYKDIYYPATIVKFLKAVKPDKAPVILFGGNGTEHRYIAAAPLDTRLWMWETVAAGGGLWNCHFNGYYPADAPDARNAYITTDAYQYIKTHEKILETMQPVTDIGVVYSKPSGEMVGDAEFGLSLKGIQRLMAENHYQYGFVSDRQISMDYLKNFKILILPNIVYLDANQTEIIKTWVKNGGKLISSYQTSLFDQSGKTKANFGLSEVFGVRSKNQLVNTEMDCYQKIITRNQFTKGFAQTTLLHNAGKTLLCELLSEAKEITGYLPKINNQPPEYAYPENWDAQSPIMVWNQYGNGESVYFANEIEKLNYSPGHPDYKDLLFNTIEHYLYKNQRFQTNAPASVHTYLNKNAQDKKSYNLSIVNTSSSSNRPFRELIPVAKTEYTLPFEIASVKKLYTKNAGTITFKGRKLIISGIDEFVSLELKSK